MGVSSCQVELLQDKPRPALKLWVKLLLMLYFCFTSFVKLVELLWCFSEMRMKADVAVETREETSFVHMCP